MRKKLILLALSLAILFPAFTQQKDFEWRLGFSGGYANYYGDLSPYRIKGLQNWDAIYHLLYFNENYFDRPSFKITLEKQLTPTVGLMFSYGDYQFSMSDRYIQRDGTLLTSNPNFGRSLNFQNQTRDMGLGFVFKTDNDRFLSSNAFAAPYFTVGVGYITYDVNGDLLDDAGQPYNYPSDQLINNSNYETYLPQLRTETAAGYDLAAFYTNLGLGIRFRLGNRLELFAQSDFLYTFTGHLDDVDGTYRQEYVNNFQEYAARPNPDFEPENINRGDPNISNDWIIYHGIGLRINIGSSKTTFSAPRLSTPRPTYDTPTVSTPRVLKEAKKIVQEKEEKDSSREEATGSTINYYTNIQMGNDEQLDQLFNRVQLNDWMLQIQTRELERQQIKNTNQNLREISRKITEQERFLERDTLLSQTYKDSLNELSLNVKTDLSETRDSLSIRDEVLSYEIDSLSALISSNMSGYQLNRSLLLRGQPTRNLLKEEDWEKRQLPQDSLIKPEKKPEQTTTQAQSQQEESTSTLQRQVENPSDEKFNELSGQINQLAQETRQLREENRNLRENNQRQLESQQRLNQAQLEATQRAATSPPVVMGQSQPVQTQERGGLSQQNQGSRAISEPEIEEANIASMAFVSTFLGLPLQSSAPTRPDTQATASTKEPTAPEVIIQRDTIRIESPTETIVLKSKETIYFDINQRQPEASSIGVLEDIVSFMKNNEGYRLVLTGFADNTGNINYNLKLAEERMKNVGQLIKEKYGISENNITYETGGQVIRGTQRTSNETDRKVEVRIEKK